MRVKSFAATVIKRALLGKLILLYALCVLSSLTSTQRGQESRFANDRGLRSDLRQEIAVGPNVQISVKNGERAHYEVRVAVDPAHSQQLLACSMVWSSKENLVRTIVYISPDGGRNWTPTLETEPTVKAADPDCGFGLDGTGYFATLVNSKEMRIYRSPDGGWKWENPVVLPYIDREYLTVDHTSGKHRGRIYLHGNATRGQTVDGDRRAVFTLFRSDDGGRTWLSPIKLLPDGDSMPFAAGNGAVLSDGAYVALFPEWSNRHNLQQPPLGETVGAFKVVRSENGGDSFAKAGVVSLWHCPYFRCEGSSGGAIMAGLPSLAADHTDGPFRDRLYSVWSDKRSDRCDIFFSYSADNGKTWSPAKIINDEPDLFARERMTKHHMPVVAVNNVGVVAVTWYDGRDNYDDQGWWTRFTASLDGGETFLPSVRISAAPQAHKPGAPMQVDATRNFQSNGMIRSVILPVTGELYGGDTAGMAADADGVFHPVWVDNRTGVLQVWTAPVTVVGNAIRNGAEDLAVLEDVTQNVILSFSDTNFDHRTGILSLDARLTNTSTTTLRPPIKIRVIGLRTATGEGQIVNADNNQHGTGAVWNFSDLIDGGMLRPGEKTRARRFEFRLKDIQPFRPNKYGKIAPGLINLETKALGNAPD